MSGRAPESDALLVTGLKVNYGLDVQALIERRTVRGIVAGDGSRYMWKKALQKDDELRLSTLAYMTNFLNRSNVPCAGPIPNLVGSYLTELHPEMSRGYLQPWLPGRHVDVREARERIAVLTSLGRMHQSSVLRRHGSAGSLVRGSLIAKLRLKTKTFSRLWPDVVRRIPELRSLERDLQIHLQECMSAYERTYFIWRSDSRLFENRMSFCHRDLAPHNALYQADGQVAFIDFDHAGYDDPLHDVSQFISHSFFLTNMKASDVRDEVAHYVRTVELDASREQLLWKLLLWPDMLIRSMAEWYRQGCPEDRIGRVRYAAHREIARQNAVNEAIRTNRSVS